MPSYIRLARGDVDGSLSDAMAGIRFARTKEDPRVLAQALAALALVQLRTGSEADVEPVVQELLQIVHTADAYAMSLLALDLFELRHTADALALLEHAEETKWRAATELELRGKSEEAAEIYAQIGDRYAEALARMRAAERLAGEGFDAQAHEQVEKALVFWRAVDATFYIERGEALLAKSSRRATPRRRARSDRSSPRHSR